MDTLEGKAFEIAEEFTLKVLENPNNSIVCCEQGGQYVVDYFNTIYLLRWDMPVSRLIRF